MDRQIIEITNNGFSLSLYRGFLVVENKEQNIRQDIALDNILSLVLSAEDIVLSKNIVDAVCEQGGNIIFCGKTYLPTAMVMPYVGHWLMAPRVRSQTECSKPLQKNLWKSIVQNKILNQAKILSYFFPKSAYVERLKNLAKSTLSNDATNNEGLAAGIYFKSLFGKDFKRDRLNDDANLLLNYTYTVLRAMVARAVAGNGLLPYLGLKHCTRANPLPLVDDLIEPFRAVADKIVFEELNRMVDVEHIELTPDIKRRLVKIVMYPVKTAKGEVSLSDGISEFVGSLAASFAAKKVMLKYPNILIEEMLSSGYS